MLVIRRVQMEVMEKANWRDFEQDAYRYCQECFPQTCALLGEKGVWAYVHEGLRLAGKYGFSSAPELLKYLTLMFTVGPDFDRLPWAAETLRDPQYVSSVRIGILLDSATIELAKSSTRGADRTRRERVG